MGRFVDLTGKVFGKLTVVEIDLSRKSYGNIYWLCQCSCGNENLSSVCTAELNSGKVKSCGCIRNKSWRFIDLTGQTYGKITVVELDHIDKKNGHYWKCLCDCGNPEYFLVNTHNIRSGAVLSCGCLNKESGIKRRDKLIGQTFNQLTIFDWEINEDGRLLWLSKCDCGSDKIVKCTGAELKSGKTKSCGCFRTHKLPNGESAFNRLYSSYKVRAKEKNFEFDFTKDEFREITKQKCFYCGREPFQKAPPNIERYQDDYYIYSGVDRIDSNKGYTKENSVPCCGQCNISKNNYTEEQFIEWVRMTYLNLKEKGVIKD